MCLLTICVITSRRKNWKDDLGKRPMLVIIWVTGLYQPGVLKLVSLWARCLRVLRLNFQTRLRKTWKKPKKLWKKWWTKKHNLSISLNTIRPWVETRTLKLQTTHLLSLLNIWEWKVVLSTRSSCQTKRDLRFFRSMKVTIIKKWWPMKRGKRRGREISKLAGSFLKRSLWWSMEASTLGNSKWQGKSMRKFIAKTHLGPKSSMT